MRGYPGSSRQRYVTGNQRECRSDRFGIPVGVIQPFPVSAPGQPFYIIRAVGPLSGVQDALDRPARQAVQAKAAAGSYLVGNSQCFIKAGVGNLVGC